MNKDKVKTIRVNGEILKTLERDGWSVQKLFDWAVNQKVKIETTIKLKGKK